MEKIVLKAKKRTLTGKQVSQLRRQGLLPAVIYGRGVEPVAIVLEAHQAGLVLGKLTSSSLITIDVEGKEYPTLVREKQRDYLKNVLKHVDFLAVSLTEKIRAKVGVHITGVSPAVKDFNAVIVTGLTMLTVECLPQELPARFDVDISGLKAIGDGIHVRDITMSDKVRLLEDLDEMLVLATASREEKVEEAAEGVEPSAAEPELSVERGKKEDESE